MCSGVAHGQSIIGMVCEAWHPSGDACPKRFGDVFVSSSLRYCPRFLPSVDRVPDRVRVSASRRRREPAT